MMNDRRSYNRGEAPRSGRELRKAGGHQAPEVRQPRRPARRVDTDQCPEGYDTDVWHLALLFEQKATENGVALSTGRPVIYSLLMKRCDEIESARDKPVPEGKLPLYWGVTADSDYDAVYYIAEAAITDEWDNYWQDTNSAREILQPVEFMGIVRRVCKRGHMLNTRKKIASGLVHEYEPVADPNRPPRVSRHAK